MKKNNLLKKTLSFVVIIACVLSLAACSNETSADENVNSDTVTESVVDSEKDAELDVEFIEDSVDEQEQIFVKPEGVNWIGDIVVYEDEIGYNTNVTMYITFDIDNPKNILLYGFNPDGATIENVSLDVQYGLEYAIRTQTFSIDSSEKVFSKMLDMKEDVNIYVWDDFDNKVRTDFRGNIWNEKTQSGIELMGNYSIQSLDEDPFEELEPLPSDESADVTASATEYNRATLTPEQEDELRAQYGFVPDGFHEDGTPYKDLGL